MSTVTDKSTRTGSIERLADMWEVVLYNDNHNEAMYVVACLQTIFGHSRDLAVRIMIEAHTGGRAIAEVEEEAPARRHRDALGDAGLSAEIYRVGS